MNGLLMFAFTARRRGTDIRQIMMPFGSPTKVKEKVHQILKVCGTPEGGIIAGEGIKCVSGEYRPCTKRSSSTAQGILTEKRHGGGPAKSIAPVSREHMTRERTSWNRYTFPIIR